MNELYTHILESIIDLDTRDDQVPRDQRLKNTSHYLEEEIEEKQPVVEQTAFDSFGSI